MRCYVALSYVFYLIGMKTCIQHLNRKLLRKLASYKACVRVNTYLAIVKSIVDEVLMYLYAGSHMLEQKVLLYGSKFCN